MLASVLPAPKHNYNVLQEETETVQPAIQPAPRKVIPPYPHRSGFVPLEAGDFGEGGAFPEIHVVQYPLDMGKPGQKSMAIVPVQVDEKGKLKTDIILRQGVNRNKNIQSQLSDLKEKTGDKKIITI